MAQFDIMPWADADILLKFPLQLPFRDVKIVAQLPHTDVAGIRLYCMDAMPDKSVLPAACGYPVDEITGQCLHHVLRGV